MCDEKTGFEKRITNALDEDVARLDAATRARLRQARARALESIARGSHRRAQWWLPAGAAVASVVLAVVLWWGRGEPVAMPPMTPADFELLTAEESLELYQELDFYLWLEREAERAG